MSIKTDLAMAYHMGYEDSLAKHRPDASKTEALVADLEDLEEENAKCAVALDYEGKLREDEGKAINRAFSAYNSAHYDILHPKEVS